MGCGIRLTFVRRRIAGGAVALLHILLSLCICCALAPLSVADVVEERGCCASECAAAMPAPSAAIAPEKTANEKPLAAIAAIAHAETDSAATRGAFEPLDAPASRLFIPLTTIQLRI